MTIPIEIRLILCSFLFSWAAYVFSIESSSFIYAFPAVFGISIPIAIWETIGKQKILKIFASGVISTAVFYLAYLVSYELVDTDQFAVSFMVLSAISGVNGIILLALFSFLLPVIRPSLQHYIISFLLCSSSVFIGWLLDDLGMTYMIWTFLFTVSLMMTLNPSTD